MSSRSWYAFRRDKKAMFGAVIVALFLAIGLLGPGIIHSQGSNPFQISRERLEPPSVRFPMGTDHLGRDVLKLFVVGARTSIVVGLLAATVSLAVGAVVGGIAGYFGGPLDSGLMRVADAFMVVPRFLLMLVVASIFGSSIPLIIVVLGALGWTRIARLTRVQFLSLRERDFSLASRALGASNARIMWKAILPNAIAPLVVDTTLQTGTAILLEAYLAFLGLGDTSVISWGQMLQYAQQFLDRAWWMSVFPGAGIFLLVLALNLLGDGLNDVWNPRG